MALRRLTAEAGTPGASTEYMAECVKRGRDAEINIARRLRRLGRAYYVVHDLPLPLGGDADHIVVGPTGVFAIETKGYRGEVEVSGDGILLNGRPPKRDAIKQVRGAARQVQRLLRDQLGLRLWVQAVVCFEGTRLERSQVVRRVLVTRPDHLCYLIAHWRGIGLYDEGITDAFHALAARLQGTGRHTKLASPERSQTLP